MDTLAEYQNNIRSLERYFTDTDTSAILFAVSNDEKLQQQVNDKLQFLGQGKRKKVYIFSWRRDAAIERHPLNELESFIKKHNDIQGLIMTDLDYALSPNQNPYLLTQLNFSREAIMAFKLPILIWATTSSLPLLSQNARDLYSQRISSNLYFDDGHENADSDHHTAQYIIRETIKANPNIAHLESRVKLLHEQLDEALRQKMDKSIIANDIALPLLECYRQIPGTEKETIWLLNQYQKEWDISNAYICFTLGHVYQEINDLHYAVYYYQLAVPLFRQVAESNNARDLANFAATLNNLALLWKNNNELKKAEEAYQETLGIQRDLAKTNPQSYQSGVAMTLNNLTILWADKKEFTKAEEASQEALIIRRDLAKTNPQSYLPDVAATLNNLAILWKNKNEFTKAEEAYQEALEIYKDLAKINPQSYLPEVTLTLNNLANLWRNKNEFTKAEEAYQEALEIIRDLAKTNPQSYLPDVAMTLNNMAVLWADKNEFTKAEEAYQEALDIYRDLAKTNPQSYLPGVAMMANNLSLLYTYSVPDKVKALAYVKETLLSGLPFADFLPRVQDYIDKALRVVKHFDEDPDKFLEEAKKELAASPPLFLKES